MEDDHDRADGHKDEDRDHRHVHAHEPILDIGGDIGALLLHTGSTYVDREIEISPIGDDTSRIHTAIHARSVDGRTVYAGLYPELRAGEYRVWIDDPRLPDRVTIVGGAVAELDWTVVDPS